MYTQSKSASYFTGFPGIGRVASIVFESFRSHKIVDVPFTVKNCRFMGGKCFSIHHCDKDIGRIIAESFPVFLWSNDLF